MEGIPGRYERRLSAPPVPRLRPCLASRVFSTSLAQHLKMLGHPFLMVRAAPSALNGLEGSSSHHPGQLYVDHGRPMGPLKNEVRLSPRQQLFFFNRPIRGRPYVLRMIFGRMASSHVEASAAGGCETPFTKCTTKQHLLLVHGGGGRVVTRTCCSGSRLLYNG